MITRDEAIDDILDMLHPRNQRACRADVAATVRRMAALRDYATKPLPKGQLGRVTKALAKLEKEAAKLPRDLVNVERAINHIAQRVMALKQAQSAGAAKRYMIPMRQLAAEEACDLVVRWRKQRVSLNRTGPYLKIASVLFEVATGKIGADLERQCRAYVESALGSIANYRRTKRNISWRDIPLYRQEKYKKRAKD